MSEFTHVCLYERQRIEKYLRRGKSRRFIAAKLDRSVSSVSDEVNGNSVRGVYTAKKADIKAYQKRWRSKLQCMRVAMDPELKKFVVECMTKDDQSPAGISGRLGRGVGLQYASPKAIYNFVYSPGGRQIERHLYSRAVHKKSGPKRNTPVTIDGRIMIDERPKKVAQRLEFGHYEGDFIESGKEWERFAPRARGTKDTVSVPPVSGRPKHRQRQSRRRGDAPRSSGQELHH